MFPITKDCVQKKTFRISGRFGKAFHRLHAHTVDQFLHPFRAGFTHFVNNVAVFIQRESCGIVPHVLLQGLDIIAGFNAVYSECMTKIMDPVMLQAGFLQNFLEFLPDLIENGVIVKAFGKVKAADNPKQMLEELAFSS
jgi:hypothetical protein